MTLKYDIVDETTLRIWQNHIKFRSLTARNQKVRKDLTCWKHNKLIC